MSVNKLIGGEYAISFELTDSAKRNGLFPYYSLGRTCLHDILQIEQLEQIIIPDYICGSVIEVIQKLGISAQLYHVSDSFHADMDSVYESLDKIEGSLSKTGIMLVSYFGMVDLEEDILLLRRQYEKVTIIIDDVQNFYGFGEQKDYDYCFTSYRKWFPVPDGADIIHKNNSKRTENYDSNPQYVWYKNAGNLLKNFREMVDDSIMLELLKKGESLMDENYLFQCSDVGRRMIQYIEIEEAGEKRRKNALYLHRCLSELGIKHLYVPDRIPFFIPIIISNRDIVRKKLFENNIFAPIHWPIVYTELQGGNDLYFNELSLICDQRYDEEDMDKIIRGLESAI